MASKAAKAKYRKQKELIVKRSANMSPIQIRKRCEECGRPRGYIRRFKLCRICFRRMALQGKLPGVRKLSW